MWQEGGVRVDGMGRCCAAVDNWLRLRARLWHTVFFGEWRLARGVVVCRVKTLLNLRGLF